MKNEREQFLRNVSEALRRTALPKNVVKPDWRGDVQHQYMKGCTQEEIVEAFKTQCQNLTLKLFETTPEKIKETMRSVIQEYGGGSVIYADDEQFVSYGLENMFQEMEDRHEACFVKWEAKQGKEKNIEAAQNANIGITFASMGLAESGSILQKSSSGCGRSVSLLPITHIALIHKSAIVPRMTQTAIRLREQFAKNQENFPSNLTYITGPSNSADIEMVLVVGVHGPVHVAYILIDDLV